MITVLKVIPDFRAGREGERQKVKKKKKIHIFFTPSLRAHSVFLYSLVIDSSPTKLLIFISRKGNFNQISIRSFLHFFTLIIIISYFSSDLKIFLHNAGTEVEGVKNGVHRPTWGDGFA